MSTRDKKHWLLAYDIREPRRLRRIQSYVAKRAWPLQYSFYGMPMSELHLRDMLKDLQQLMDAREDDIRIYALPKCCKVWMLGQQSLPDGIDINAEMLLELMVPDFLQGI